MQLARRVAEEGEEGAEEAMQEECEESETPILAREQRVGMLCEVVRSAFETIEPLYSQHRTDSRVTPHNLLTFLSLLELTAISLVRKLAVENIRRVPSARKSCDEPEDKSAGRPPSLHFSSSPHIPMYLIEPLASVPAATSSPTTTPGGMPKSAESDNSKPASSSGRRRRLTIVPPSMGPNALSYA